VLRSTDLFRARTFAQRASLLAALAARRVMEPNSECRSGSPDQLITEDNHVESGLDSIRRRLGRKYPLRGLDLTGS